MKIHIKESNEDMIYVGLAHYSNTLEEDMIKPDDIIEVGSFYGDQYDTRKFLLLYLKEVAKTLKQFVSVKDCSSRPASKKTKRGLSEYLDITLEHPDGLTEKEIEDNYMFTIRFSDHDPSNKDGLIGNILIVGMKPKNFGKAAVKILRTNRTEIQKQISEFEKVKYGKAVSTIIF